MKQFFIILLIISTKGYSQKIESKDSIFILQDSSIRIASQWLMLDALSYPKVHDSDKRNASIIYELIDILIINKEIAAKTKQTFLNIYQKDTSKQDIGNLLFSYEFEAFLFKNKIPFFRRLDWKALSSEMVNFINEVLKNNYRVNKTLNRKNFVSQIDPSYKEIGKEVAQIKLELVNIDINCDCYIPLVVKPTEVKRVKSLFERLGYKLEKYTEIW